MKKDEFAETKANEAYVLVALRRVTASKGENTGLTKLCHRSVVRPGETVEECAASLKKMCHEEGNWRIYRSVNKRDLKKAMDQTQIQMIIHPEQTMHKVSSIWKSTLMKSECRAEKKFLLDFDSNNASLLEEVKCAVIRAGGEILEVVKSPNGYGVVTTGFDVRVLKDDYYECEVKRDALLFQEQWTNQPAYEPPVG
jgi:hypothetical protein